MPGDDYDTTPNDTRHRSPLSCTVRSSGKEIKKDADAECLGIKTAEFQQSNQRNSFLVTKQNEMSNIFWIFDFFSPKKRYVSAPRLT
jgi:hypothetical protein